MHDSGKKSAMLLPNPREIYDPGAPHGLTATMRDQVNADLLAFIRGEELSHEVTGRGQAAARAT